MFRGGQIMGENDRAWCSREKGAPKHAQTCARADTHVQIHPRARARASPRGAGDKRDGQVAAQTWRKRCRRQRRRRSPRPSRRRRGPGTRSGRVVDVREARERVTTGRGVERGRPASAGRRAQDLFCSVVVYYCRTYEKAVSGGGEREKGGHVLRDTTSRGLYVRFWPPHTSERRGGGRVVSKKVGPGNLKEEWVAQG